MAKPSSSSVFKIERREAELIPPSKPTPYEFKLLSDIDDQKSFWKHTPIMQIYQYNQKMTGIDPVKVIKQAISDALVYYYPLAGRLREGVNGKLMVECTGEGVLFIEANAKMSLDVFAGAILPPVPGAEELLYEEVPGSEGILNSPLLLIQVTRFMCGGFTFVIRVNHTMCDATGLIQFTTTIGEMARGACIPSVEPVWKREALSARDPPRVSCEHHVYHAIVESQNRSPDDIKKLVHGSFFFGPQDLSVIRNYVNISACSNFDILTAFLWRTRTMALNLDPDDVVRVTFAVNTRKKFNPQLLGYYGNAIAKPVALSTVNELCRNSLEYAVNLIIKAKNSANEEFMRSTADFLVINDRPSFSNVGMYHVSDLTSIKFKDIDFGWGTCIYGGPLRVGRPASYVVATKSIEGEEGLVVTISLPKVTMEMFVIEFEKIVKVDNNLKSSFIVSSL